MSKKVTHNIDSVALKKVYIHNDSWVREKAQSDFHSLEHYNPPLFMKLGQIKEISGWECPLRSFVCSDH